MKLRLLGYIRCPRCRGRLVLHAGAVQSIDRPSAERAPVCSGLCGGSPDAEQPRGCHACDRIEVMTGNLTCAACGSTFDVRDGVPRLMAAAPEHGTSEKSRTSRSFGYLWAQSAANPNGIPSSYHFDKLTRALALKPARGVVLDAGCGEGIDLVNQARRPGVEAIGAELSDGGCRTTARRIVGVPTAHVVQADLGRLPFDGGSFDFVYSYGVLHHMPVPVEGLAELTRVMRPGASIAIYLYEDFSDRAIGWRWLLGAANSLRRISTRMPPPVLYALCRIASPVTFLVFTVPHRLLAQVPGLRAIADTIPFRHGGGPFRLTGDLYDRFSAPVEYRYSREGAVAFMESAGLSVVRVAKLRGWMALGVTPTVNTA